MVRATLLLALESAWIACSSVIALDHRFRCPDHPDEPYPCGPVFALLYQRTGAKGSPCEPIVAHVGAEPVGAEAPARRQQRLAARIAPRRLVGGARGGRVLGRHGIEVVMVALLCVKRASQQTEVPAR